MSTGVSRRCALFTIHSVGFRRCREEQWRRYVAYTHTYLMYFQLGSRVLFPKWIILGTLWDLGQGRRMHTQQNIAEDYCVLVNVTVNVGIGGLGH